jgi:catechol 2,3-dioxygenase-like lactoylglutathione lyase family enzyme
MKRLHVHTAVTDLNEAIRFYSHLFAAEPTVRKDDYAKWMLDDPRVNFAISARGEESGIRHLGIQVESEAELAEVYQRLENAAAPVLEEGAVTCCYAKSEKSWVADPAGTRWEVFRTFGESTVYGGGAPVEAVRAVEAAPAANAACCEPAPKPQQKSSCCPPKAA